MFLYLKQSGGLSIIQKLCRCWSVFSSWVDQNHVWPDELQQIKLFCFVIFLWSLCWSLCCAGGRTFWGVIRLRVVSWSAVGRMLKSTGLLCPFLLLSMGRIDCRIERLGSAHARHIWRISQGIQPGDLTYKYEYWPSEVIAKPDKWIIVMCDYNPFTDRQ